jgi:hypothetical protein
MAAPVKNGVTGEYSLDEIEEMIAFLREHSATVYVEQKGDLAS